MLATAAFELCRRIGNVNTVLDVGCGDGEHARRFLLDGRHVSTVSYTPPADYVGDYVELNVGQRFDLVWASHVLEHQRNVGAFIDKLRRDCRVGGWIAITVPPMKEYVVGGHVALFNAGILLYHLVLSGIDCRAAKVKTYGYNVSVIVQNNGFDVPKLRCDVGDIETLAKWFPAPVHQGIDGRIDELNWSP